MVSTPVPGSLFSSNVCRSLVRVEALERRVPDPPVVSPLGELDLDYEPQIHPVRPFRERAARRGIEWRCLYLDGLDELAECATERVVPSAARTDLPGKPQRAAVVLADEDRADSDARPF